jgi:mannose-6-phosphate isomerase-like protein (cupin superfamily)
VRIVLEVGKRYTSPNTGTWVQVAERPGALKLERCFAPGLGRADPHFHEDFVQTWEVLSGEGRIEIDGEERDFKAGDRAVIEPNVPHRDPWNPSSGELHLRGTFDPPSEFIERFAEVFARKLTEGKGLTDQDELPLLQILVIARDTNARSWAAKPPVAIQKASLPLLAAIGRLRGYKPHYD